MGEGGRTVYLSQRNIENFQKFLHTIVEYDFEVFDFEDVFVMQTSSKFGFRTCNMAYLSSGLQTLRLKETAMGQNVCSVS